MIRLYEDRDFDKLDGNEFIDSDLYGDRLRAILGAYMAYTLDIDGEIVAIIAFREYFKGCYTAFLLCSKAFTAKYAKSVKVFIQGCMASLGANRVETLSLKNDRIDRFHQFLGFELEGTKRRFYNDKDYNMWAWLGGKYGS